MTITSIVSSPINYGMTVADQTIKKIATSPSAVKKVLGLTTKIYAAFDLSQVGHSQKREITKVMSDTMSLIGIYSSYKSVMYWVYLFSKESLDTAKLEDSLKSSLCASHIDKDDIAKQEKIAERVFADVMLKKSYHSKGEVQQVLKASLELNGYSPLKAQQISELVIIQQKSRPLVELIATACDGIGDMADTLSTLKKWNILDLSGLVSSIGSQSPVFMFVMNAATSTALGTIACVGLVFAVGNDSYHVIMEGLKYSRSGDPKEKEGVSKKMRDSLLDLASHGTDLAAVAAPLLFALNPATLIAMSLVSKGTGLACILAR